MSWVAVGAAAVGVVGGIVTSNTQKNAAKDAATAQGESSASAIAEQRRQFEAMRELLSPYTEAGQTTLTGQMDLIGMNGAEAQSNAINLIQSGQEYGRLVNQGEEAILANASATGGLRGGNTQHSLANFRSDLLNNLITTQYNRLGGITQLGQASASGQAAQGSATATNISNLLTGQGNAQAANLLQQGQIQSQLISDTAGAIGTIIGDKF